MNLREAVQARLVQLTFLLPLKLEDMPEDECDALAEGSSSHFIEGLRVQDVAAICINRWGRNEHARISFSVFEFEAGEWREMGSRIEHVHEALALAIHILAERP